MSTIKPKKSISKQSLVFIGFFIAAFAFMLWKCPYGFGGSDEAFYLTVPHRLTLGDELFRDEWHLSQLSAFFTLPFVSIYRAINGSNDGIMLAARYTYVFIHAAVAVILYIRLRKYGVFSIAACVLFMLFTPFDMMVYSYNTIALDTLAISGVFAGTAGAKSHIDYDYILAGIFFAFAVVCCPYLAVVYAFYAGITAISAIREKKTQRTLYCRLFSGRVFLQFTLGAIISAVLFAIFFFRHSGIKQLINSLPGIFSDPEHPSYSVIFMLKHYVYCLVTAHRLILIPLGIYALSLIYLAADKKRSEHALRHLMLAAFSAVVCWALFASELTEKYYNGITLPLIFVGFTAYLLTDNKPRELFISLFIVGLCYSACVCATSNMGFDVMSMGFSVANIAGVIFLGLAVQHTAELSEKRRRMACAAAAAVIGCAAVLTVTVKATHCFWDGSPSELEYKISDGPARGIVTSERLCSDYEKICAELKALRETSPGGVLVYAQETWCYLILDDCEYSTFSAWLSGLDSTAEDRLKMYYELNPEKYPDCVYILKDLSFAQPGLDGTLIAERAAAEGFTVTETDISWTLTRQSD